MLASRQRRARTRSSSTTSGWPACGTALKQLRPEEQEVFLLRQNGELTYEEIAETLGRADGNGEDADAAGTGAIAGSAGGGLSCGVSGHLSLVVMNDRGPVTKLEDGATCDLLQESKKGRVANDVTACLSLVGRCWFMQMS